MISKIGLATIITLASIPALVFSQGYDLVIYGGTSAAVVAAVQAKKMGKTVVVVSPDRHLGGLSSGGLGWTDTGNKAVVGGLSREFYHRIWKYYQKDSSWRQQTREEYGKRKSSVDETMWVFEPHVAEQVFEGFIKEFSIEVIRDAWLDRSESGVTLKEGRITSMKTLDGKVYRGKMYLDATYEGDLMAAAGVDYDIGRESRETYGEEWNGVQTGVLHHRHHFDVLPGLARIDPYLIKGDPKSGLLPKISPDPPGEKHAGDHRVQAYCFRMCLTNEPSNRIPFSKPKNYDPNDYELLVRIFETGWKDTFRKFDPLPNHKTDTNNHGPMSTDNIGMNYQYPDGTYEERRAIIAEHENYQKGWLYFIANDPRVPDAIREEMRTWGLPKDEFTDNGNWSHQLYIREARRMIGNYVMTENELLKKRPTPQSVGMGSYTIDSHNVQRYVTPEGYVQNEGDIGVKCSPYEIAYGSLVPKKSQCKNLVVPVCVSSSHIAFGSIRMEPVFMILGQSAATAAGHAIDEGVALQDINFDRLQNRLVDDGQILEFTQPEATTKRNSIPLESLEGVVVDDTGAVYEGTWKDSFNAKQFLGLGYKHDGGTNDGKSTATFRIKVPEPGWYEVLFAYTPHKNRASNVPVSINHIEGHSVIKVNEREEPQVDGMFEFLGVYEFIEDVTVTITNEGTDGHVVVDGIQCIKINQ